MTNTDLHTMHFTAKNQAVKNNKKKDKSVPVWNAQKEVLEVKTSTCS